MNRGDLTDKQWKRLATHIPPQKPQTGRPNLDHRQIINGILWVLRTGAPWRDLPERYGPWSTVYSRFYRWQKAGIWERIFTHLQAEADAANTLDWAIHDADSSVVRAHQHAAGAHHSTPAAEALGRSQGGFSTKVHVRIEGQGRRMTLVLTPGQAHEAPILPKLMAQGIVKRCGRGRPQRCPRRLVADKADDSQTIRRDLRRQGIRYTIPHRAQQRRRGSFDQTLYRLRNLVERFINRVKQFRRIATRYEKRAEQYRAFWLIAASLLWLKFAYTP
jgi:transposase